MDFLKITKVENVQLEKSGEVVVGTLHLTTHQMIFKYSDNKEELWISYPIIHTVERRPPTSEPRYWPLLIKCRNFIFVTISVPVEKEAIDVFDTIQKLTCISSISQLYAFYYKPEKEFRCKDGWEVYDTRKEFTRMGVFAKSSAWRFSSINENYMICPTYPYMLIVPYKISDNVLNHAAKFRSKSRIPTLSYFHHHNKATITRSSQPMVGIQKKRSIQDEKLIQAIFESNLTVLPNGRPVYGSTPHNLIIDARPTANAMANTAMGAGSENTEYYKNCERKFMGIDNIHVMRESLAKMVDTLQIADSQGLPIKKYQLDKSNWLKHISTLLVSAHVIIKTVNVNASHVLIHCSDGWDRTAQLTSISELCLDPYYRTFRGFQVLVEKEWVSFGHKFSDRSGHLSNERYFINMSNTNAAGSAFNSVQSKFYKQSHVREISPVFHQFLDCVYQLFHQNPTRFEFNEDFLVGLHYHCYSCQFGTFLLNSEKERKENHVTEKTYSVWDYFNSDRELYLNPLYCGEEEDKTSKEDMGVLYPDTKNLKYWAKLFKREDEELNGNKDEITEEKSRWRSDNSSPKSETPSIMTDPLGVMEIGGNTNNNGNGIWNNTPTMSEISVSSPIGKTTTDLDAGLDPWSNNDYVNNKKEISFFEEDKESNVQDMVAYFAKTTIKNVYSNVSNVATNVVNRINLDLDSNSPSIKNSNEDSEITTPKEELVESDYNNRSSTPSTPGTPKLREMVSFGSNGNNDNEMAEVNNGIVTSSNSNGRYFPVPFLTSRKESNRNSSLPSLGIRTTPPTSPYLYTNSGSSTPIYEKQEKQSSPISFLTNGNDGGGGSPSSKSKINGLNVVNGLNELEKSLMLATNTSINPSGLGLGLNFGSDNNSSDSSNSASRTNSLGANVSLGGSDTNSRNNSPLSTPIQNSPSILKPQDKMKELPHPLYNDPLSSP
ncbi:phosphatases II [Rhizophagus irregularis]|uniref:Phosphatases II n=1 Tax=Rhizophagus irregularis TaxID=588596 RepID=A0A2I1GEH3_9GLOM|nr:phosphatases II [Rhizophagus irregularis]